MKAEKTALVLPETRHDYSKMDSILISHNILHNNADSSAIPLYKKIIRLTAEMILYCRIPEIEHKKLPLAYHYIEDAKRFIPQLIVNKPSILASWKETTGRTLEASFWGR